MRSCLYADWNMPYKSFAFRWSTHCTQTIRSSNLETKEKLETARQFLKISQSTIDFLIRGVRKALLNSSVKSTHGSDVLTHWGRVTHICVGKITIIGSDNGLSPGRRQAIIWTNAGILLIGPLGTNPSQIVIGIQTFSFKKMHLKVSSAKWRPFCIGFNVLTITVTTGATWSIHCVNGHVGIGSRAQDF